LGHSWGGSEDTTHDDEVDEGEQEPVWGHRRDLGCIDGRDDYRKPDTDKNLWVET